MENEVVKNEEVIETTIETAEEVVTAKSGKGFKVAAGIGFVTIAGVLVYKYVAKPIIARYKTRKEQSGIVEAEIVTGTFTEHDEEESEETEE